MERIKKFNNFESTSGEYYGGTKSGKLLNYVRRFKDFI
jgi:hypothetical protein